MLQRYSAVGLGAVGEQRIEVDALDGGASQLLVRDDTLQVFR